MAGTRIECDVCVIGSGAGGAAAAYQLARGGLDTVVLEKGIWREDPAWPSGFDNDELMAAARKRPMPEVDGGVTWYEILNDGGRPEPVRWGQGHGLVGGLTVLYAASSWRFRDEDFLKKTLYGERYARLDRSGVAARLVDWPKPVRDAIGRYYALAEEIVGIAGDDRDDPTRPAGPRAPYLPPLEPHPFNERLAASARARRLRPFPIPMAITSVDRADRERKACVSCGFCSGYPCVWESKNSADEVFLKPALRAGKLRVVTRATARKLRAADRGRRVEAVEFDGDDPALPSGEVHARVVILAAGAIISPLILLRSPDLCFTRDPVGRYLTFHMDYKLEASFPALRGHPFRMMKKLAILDRYLPAASANHVNHCSLQTGSKVLPIGFAASKKLEMAHGRPLLEAIANEYAATFELQLIGEDLSVAANVVEPHPDKVDRRGDPLPRIRHRYHPMDLEAVRATVPLMIDLLEGAGGVVHAPASVSLKPSGSHLMGTLCMGEDAGTSVVNADGRLHEVENLYVADGSVFPTSAGLNPALTIQALALRTADRILEQWRPA